jgi:hypothetical protein
MIAAFANIRLPSQNCHCEPRPSTVHSASKHAKCPSPLVSVSPIPYIRRLVVTGLASPSVMSFFFSEQWELGVGHIVQAERQNFLLAAKSESWLSVKSHYDICEEQSVPFLVPLQYITEQEIQSAEACWSEWLAMQDWMLGPRGLDL